jgi:prophage regulatory protein
VIRAAHRNEPSKAAPHLPDDARLPPRRFLRLSEVCELVGLSRSSIYQLRSECRFPESVKVGVRSVRWRMADVLAWQARVEKRSRSV